MHQNLVAHLMTEAIIHRLEVVEIGEEQRSGLFLTVKPVDVAAQFLKEGTTIEQSSQRIGSRLARHLLLDGFMFQHHPDEGGRGVDQQHVFGVPAARAG